jgi:cytochrome c-type biogenesis protein
VLPLVPSYLSFLTGLSVDEARDRRWVTVSHALAFIVGFSCIFLALSATATTLGRALNYQRIWVERAGGVMIVLFGLYLLGAVSWMAFARERRWHLEQKPVGYVGSALVGLAFGAGWTPCIGPILGSILLYAGARDSLGQGLLLLGAYSAGLAVPFLAAALAVERFLKWTKQYRGVMVVATRASGGVLVIVGLLLATGYFTELAGWLQALTPQALRRLL